jgi:ABC-2 type transport system ATP-binding protein
VAEAGADRIGLIQAGRLCAEGTLEELGRMAGVPGAGLEEIYLALTGDGRPATGGGPES